MEPVTHLLTGACLARTGFHRRVAYATAGMAVAAEFPDIDTVWSLGGPVPGLQHHRGITHTLLGLPFEAVFLVLCLAFWHRWRQSRGGAPRRAREGPRNEADAAFPWLALYGCLLLALGSHLLLDFTNNYGIRPFFPFQPRWYAASIVFIFDPVIFVLLLCGLLLPELFALIGQEIEGHRAKFRGAGWARAALVAVLVLWCFRAYEHKRALTLAGEQTLRVTTQDGDSMADSEGSTHAEEAPLPEPLMAGPLLMARRSLASPDPFNPFRWYTATDFGSAYVLGTADTLRGELERGLTLNKPVPSPLLAVAETTTLGRVYLDWSPMPWITLSTEHSSRGSRRAGEPTTVTFEDVRFMGSSPLLHRGAQPPLSGFVVVSPDGETTEGVDGRVQP